MATPTPDAHSGKAAPSSPAPLEPCVPASESAAEFTLKAVVIGALGVSTILANNIVQTIGSAGESVAYGVVPLGPLHTVMAADRR